MVTQKIETKNDETEENQNEELISSFVKPKKEIDLQIKLEENKRQFFSNLKNTNFLMNEDTSPEDENLEENLYQEEDEKIDDELLLSEQKIMNSHYELGIIRKIEMDEDNHIITAITKDNNDPYFKIFCMDFKIHAKKRLK